MSVVGIQYGWLWAQNDDGGYDYSLTVQVPNIAAYCEIALTSNWLLDDDADAASDAFITQSVSASGVEEYPKENYTSSPLCFSIFRNQMTSVTFKVSAYYTKAMCRWAIFQWGAGIRISDILGKAEPTASAPTPRQTCFVYDSKTGQIVHVHQFSPLQDRLSCADDQMERMALANTSPSFPREHAAFLHERGPLQLDPGQRYRVDLPSRKLIADVIPEIRRERRSKPKPA